MTVRLVLLMVLATLSSPKPQLERDQSDGDLFGYAVGSLGDVDGDGWPDVLIGDQTEDAPGAPAMSPFAWAASPRSGKPLYSVGDGTERLASSRCFAPVGDVNGDDIEDFACIILTDIGGSAGLYVQLRSGADGGQLAARLLVEREQFELYSFSVQSVVGTGGADRGALLVAGNWSCYAADVWQNTGSVGIGWQSRVWLVSAVNLELLLELVPGRDSAPYLSSACGLGDLDGDGFAELAIVRGDPRSLIGSLEIVSSRDGEQLRKWADSTTSRMWPGVVSGDDYDADGVRDLLVTDVVQGGSGQRLRISILAGSSGEILAIEDCGRDKLYGPALIGLEDVDGQGVKDLLLFDHGAFSPGYGLMLSGEYLQVLVSVTGGKLDRGQDPQFGFCASGLKDVDGDTVPDFAIGAASPWSSGRSRGSLQVHSGADGSVIRHFTRKEIIARIR